MNEEYTIEIDEELISQDIDDVDFYAERTVEDEPTEYDNIQFE